MPSASMLRDSTQIVIARAILDDLDVQLDDRFTVTVVPEPDDTYRIIGSPVEIKAATEFLSTRGVTLR